MADCYFIGIGGTGSKCVNNYVYSSAAGLGPDRLWMEWLIKMMLMVMLQNPDQI